jgi:hypothetical protein
MSVCHSVSVCVCVYGLALVHASLSPFTRLYGHGCVKVRRPSCRALVAVSVAHTCTSILSHTLCVCVCWGERS